MTKPIQILHLEDNADDAELVKYALKSAGMVCQIKLIQSEEEYSQALRQGGYDLILTDYSLPHYDGLAALRLAQQVCPEVPFVFISGKMGEDTAIDALTQGATDYVLKQKLNRLVPAVQRALQEAKNQKQRKQAEQELLQERNLLRTLIDNIPDYIYVKDSKSRFLACNKALMQSLGKKSLKEVYGRTDFDFHPPEYSSQYFDQEQELILSGQPLVSHEELTFDHFYGQLQCVLTTKMPLRDQQGKVIGLVGIGRNITERKQAEAKIKKQLSQLEALHAIDTTISSTFDTQRTLRVLLEQVSRQLEVDAAAILLYDTSNQSLRYANWIGFNNPVAQWPNLGLGEGRAGAVAREKKLLHIGDLPARLTGNELDQLLQNEGFQAYYAIPLVAFDVIKGVLEIYQRRPLNLTRDWVDFLDILAGQAAIAIDTARLFNDFQWSHNQLVAAYDATIEGWSRALDLRDRETEGHTLRVTEMTIQMAPDAGLNLKEIDYVRWGARLHDIGKMGIPDSILLKPGPLTEAEWVIMRQHPNYAHDLLRPIEYLRPALEIPYCHHEKWDGSGYPRGLKGKKIPLAARIFAVADVWDALCSDRPYRQPWPRQRALDEIQAGAGSHFDPEIVEIFLKFVERKMGLTPTDLRSRGPAPVRRKKQ